MATFRGSSDPLRLMWRRIIAAFLALLCVSVAWAVWNIYRKDKEAAALRAEAQARLSDMQAQETKLESDYSRLSTGRGLEEALRDQYAVAAQGENMVVIVEPDKPQPVEATSTAWNWISKVFHW